jgi:hypothetical protein
MKNNYKKSKMITRKELTLLVSFLVMSLPSISQTVITTTKDTIICLPVEMAKMVVVDLEEGDLVRKENKILSDILTKLKSQVTIQDQIIQTKDLKINNLESIIAEKDKIISICNEEKTIIQGKVKKSFVSGTLVGIGVGALTILLL